MKTVDAERFRESMVEEIEKVLKIEIYIIIKRSIVPPEKIVLIPVWDNRRKHTPSYKVYRHISRLCIDGSSPREEIDFNNIYSPFIQWSTLRALFIIKKIKGWNTRKVDYFQAFPQASLDEEQEIFMHLPRYVHIDGSINR